MANFRANGGLDRRGILIHVVLVLVFFLPGGLIWNRMDPWILGLPFSVFMVAVLLPLLIFLNVVWIVARMWRQDLALMEQLRAGRSIVEAERGEAGR